MEDLGRLVPLMTRAEYDALPKDGTHTHETVKLNTLHNAFAFPSVEAVRQAWQPDVLKRAMESRALHDAAPGRDGHSNYLYDTDTLEVINRPERMLATWQ